MWEPLVFIRMMEIPLCSPACGWISFLQVPLVGIVA